jgi:pyroglutamyl-peptidase
MSQTLLLTSFDIWEPHHITNSSNDLLEELLLRNLLPTNVQLLQKLPVDFELAPQIVIAKIMELQPDLVVCCGMAEKRSRLTIEVCGSFETETYTTTVNVSHLVKSLNCTDLSQDAGKFVCNHLYYSVLKFLELTGLQKPCLFIHVPLLNEFNLEAIVADFMTILHSFFGVADQRYELPAALTLTLSQRAREPDSSSLLLGEKGWG